MPSLYIASSLGNWQRVKRLQGDFISRGVTISYDWTPHATALKEHNGDKNHEKDLQQYAHNELIGVINADHLLAIMPGGRGTHFEMGAMIFKCMLLKPKELAKGQLKAITILHDEDDAKFPTSFHFLAGITRIATEKEAIDHVMECLTETKS